MPKTNTKTEGVITVYDEQSKLIAIVAKDEKTRKCITYAVSEMGFDEIRSLLDGIKQTNRNENKGIDTNL